MGYFVINGLGYNCQYPRNNCPNPNISCKQCIISKLKDLGFEVTSNLELFRIVSDEKRSEMEKEIIWQKFLDVLNIKHVIIMDKESGLALLNYPVSGVDIDADLLSGFIQANITFSESSQVSKNGSKYDTQHPFYEFQYEDFNILLKNGEFIRLCLILDHKASNHMRTNVNQFITHFEGAFKEKFKALQETGLFDEEGMYDYIIDSFDIDLVFPMTLAYAIPPEVLCNINANVIQSAIYNLAKEILSEKSFFYINKLLDKVKKIVHIEPNLVLYEIYRLFDSKVILTKPLESIITDMENKYEATQKRTMEMKPISSMVRNDEDETELRSKLQGVDETTARQIIKDIIKRGKSAERSLVYQSAQEEYKKAISVSRELGFKEETKKASRLLFDLEKKKKALELNFALETGENAEKAKDFIKAIHNYQKAIELMQSNLIYDDPDPRIKKFKRKIAKLREEI
jgi:tetratricopeptide (TPR) repeat protein